MMQNKVKWSQIALILLLIVPGGKYLSLPAALAQQVGKDSWIVIAVLLLLDAICLAMTIRAAVINKHNLSFNSVLTTTVGTVPSKVIYVIFFVLLQMRIITLMASVYKLFAATFTIRSSWVGFWLPISAFCLFIVAKGFKTIARLNQLLSVLVMLSLVSILIYPATQLDVRNLLPLPQSDFATILQGTFNSTFWFADYMFLFFVLDSICPSRHPYVNVMSGFGVGAVLTVLMNVLFIALYGPLAPYTDLAMSKVSQFALALNTNGRLDWLSLSVWTTSVFIKLALFTFSAYKCLQFLIGNKQLKFNYWTGAIVVVFSLTPLFLSSDKLLKYMLPYTVYPFCVVQYVLPLFLPLLVKIANNKHDKRIVEKLNLSEVAANE